MERYNKITNKNPREIVLLKGRPCAWGKCRFCDYIEDNSRDVQEMNALNPGSPLPCHRRTRCIGSHQFGKLF